MIDAIRHEIDAKIARLGRTTASPDPALADWANRVTALARSVQAFEGALIARTIPAALQPAEHLHVVAQARLTLPRRALEAVEQDQRIALEYTDATGPTRQVDLVVFHCRTGRLEFLECKRGTKPIGRDHRRARLRDDAALELVGRSYVRKQFRQIATDCHCLTVSYYGNTGLPEDKTIRADDLDEHFDWNVRDTVEEHLSYFRARLDTVFPGVTGVAA